MPSPLRPLRFRAVAGFVFWLIFATSPTRATADREHVVRAGQSLGRIAARYGVSTGDLATHNHIRRDAALRPGQVLNVPDRGVVYVRPGQSLARIARAHDVDVRDLAKRNRLATNAALKVGQALHIPGIAPDPEKSRWGTPKQRGVATLHRIFSNQTRKVRLLDARGRLRQASVREMRDILRPRDSRKRKSPHPRLLRLLAQVSDHFGGRPIHIVSGYRLPGGFTRDSSRHVAGEALDFRIPGVPLAEVRALCEKFDHVGVGYYPRSRFVHLDVRRKSARWTDWSLPGQGPMLSQPTEAVASTDGEETSSALDGTTDERGMQDTPPAEDDGLPPIDDAPDTQDDTSGARAL